MNYRIRLFAGVAFAGVLTGGIVPAWAQDAASGPQLAGVAGENDSGEIVVTAQRRTERLSDVPVAITALTSKALDAAGVVSSKDLARITPGLAMESYGAFLQPAVRGVTSGGANVGEASNVATYVDGVYQPQQIATTFDFPDVDHIEVLKGPQGALYGQDATGGAILVNSLSPSSTTTGKFSASYGNYDAVDLRGYLSGPISDTLAASVAGGYRNHDGFRRSVIDGKRDDGLDSKAIRGRLLFKPSVDARFTLTGYYSDRSDSSAYAGQAYGGNSVGYAMFPDAPRATSPKQYTSDPDVFTRVKSWGVNLRSEIDTGAGKLTNVTAYFRNKAAYIADADYSPIQYAQAYTPDLGGHYFETDTNFASRKFGIVSFLAGVFYLKGAESFNDNGFRLFSPSLPPEPMTVIYNLPTFQKIRKEIIAGYGEVTLQPTDKLFITAGGRYTDEQLRGYSDFGTDTVTEYPGDAVSFKEFTPRVTVRYAVNRDANFYASWSKGFKSGGINVSDFALGTFKPEKITSYEVGFKGQPIEGLHFNASAFYYDYTDLQIVQYAPPTYYEENAAKARIKGVDFDLSWNVTRHLTVSGGGAFLDAHYRNANATVFVPDPVNLGNIPTPDTGIIGNRLIRAPKFSGNLAANYTLDTASGRFGAYTGLYYNSGYSMEVSGRIRQPSYATLDAELSFAPEAFKGLRLVLWGKNLTDKTYLASLLQTNFADGVTYSDPRTYGVRAEFAF